MFIAHRLNSNYIFCALRWKVPIGCLMDDNYLHTQTHLTGAGIYVTRSQGRGVQSSAQPNNTYILINSGLYYSSNSRVSFYCCSNSTSTRVVSFTFPNGITRSSDWNGIQLRRQYGIYTGCILFTISDYGRYNLNSNAGVYTCNIPDDSGRVEHVHFGLYDEDFRSKLKCFHN